VFVSDILDVLVVLQQLSFLAGIMMTVLVASGNKLGIGQDKDVSRSSMLFAKINYKL